MNKKRCMSAGYYKFMACMTCLFTLVTLVFYIILMVRTFRNDPDWLTSTFLILGLIGILTIMPTLANCFAGASKRISGYYTYDQED